MHKQSSILARGSVSTGSLPNKAPRVCKRALFPAARTFPPLSSADQLSSLPHGFVQHFSTDVVVTVSCCRELRLLKPGLCLDLSVRCFGCVCLSHDMATLLIVMKFGINRLGTKAERHTMQGFLFRSQFEMASFLWVFSQLLR